MNEQQRKDARTIVNHIAFWTALCAAGALGNYSDRLQHGRAASYPALLLEWCSWHVPVMALSSVLGLVLLRRPALFMERRATLTIYAGLVLVFLPLEWFYV